MLRIAVVGLGYWGPNLARNISASERTELAGLCDLDPVRLKSIGDRYPSARLYDDPNRVFSDPEITAVALATPVGTHFDLAMEALAAGKHVLVEKPLATSSDEAYELVECATRLDLTLMVDHVFVHSPSVERLAHIIRAGQLGEVRFVDSVRINLGLLQHDVNVIWDLAPHDLSILDVITGRVPESVIAIGSSNTGNGRVDVAYLHLDYGESLMAAVHVNWLSPVKLRHLLVGGTQRSLLYNDLDRSEPVKVYDRGIDVDTDPEGRRSMLVSYRSGDVISPKVESVEPLGVMIDHFATCVATGDEPKSGGHQGLRVVRTLEAADESLRLGGKRVRVVS